MHIQGYFFPDRWRQGIPEKADKYSLRAILVPKCDIIGTMLFDRDDFFPLGFFGWLNLRGWEVVSTSTKQGAENPLIYHTLKKTRISPGNERLI